MKISSDISWADLIQTIISIAAFFALPAVISSAWKAFRYNFKAVLRPVDPGHSGLSNTWQVEILNRSKSRVRSVSYQFVPKQRGANILFARVQSEPDGGLYISKAELQNGAFFVEVERMAPQRSILLALKMDQPGDVLIHDFTNSTRESLEEFSANFNLSINHVRLVIFGFYYFLGIFVIIARLIWLGYLTG